MRRCWLCRSGLRLIVLCRIGRIVGFGFRLLMSSCLLWLVIIRCAGLRGLIRGLS